MSGSGFVCLAMLLLVAPSALAESIFRCVEKNGEVVIRNFPCSAESTSTEFTGSAATAADAGNSKAKPSAPPQQLRAGMSKSEVRAILGNPKEVFQEEGVDGRVDTWSYGSRTLQFDAGGKLIQ